MTHTINTSTPESIYMLSAQQRHTLFQDILCQLAAEGEEEWDIDDQAHRIISNPKHYPEFF
jgi:hypothetical protein